MSAIKKSRQIENFNGANSEMLHRILTFLQAVIKCDKLENFSSNVINFQAICQNLYIKTVLYGKQTRREQEPLDNRSPAIIHPPLSLPHPPQQKPSLGSESEASEQQGKRGSPIANHHHQHGRDAA